MERRKSVVSGPTYSPLVAELAELEKHRPLVGRVGKVGKGLAQPRDYRGAREAEERVDLPFDVERRHQGFRRVLSAKAREHLARVRVVGLAVEREAKIVLYVVVARIDLRGVGKLRELPRERLVELGRMTAVVAIAGARV